MAISIKGYANFSKRRNSTKKPSGTYTTFSVVLKEETDSLNPIFILYSASYPTVNYIVWDTKHYFVDRIVIVANELYELHCSIDVMATYKTAIGNTTTFIERAASASAYDPMVTDNYVTASNTISSMLTTTVSMPVAAGDVYMVPVFGRDGVVQYVFPDLSDASKFFNSGSTITVDGNSVTATDWLNALKNAGWSFVGSDVTSYMGDMYYTPYLPPVGGGGTPYIPTNTLKFGFTEFTFTPPTPGSYMFNCLNPTNHYYKFTDTLTDPGNAYTDFRAYDSRFSQYKIYLPGCGIYDINSADAGKQDLKVDVTMDWLTMAVTYTIYHDGGSRVASFEGKMGAGVPALGSKLDVYGILQDTTAGAGSVAKEDVAGAVGSVISAASKVFEPQVNARSAGAGNGATLKNFPNIIYYLKNFATKDIPTTQAGRPCYKNKKISSCSGYNKCGNASVAIAGGAVEKEMVNNFLNSGFYYE